LVERLNGIDSSAKYPLFPHVLQRLAP